MTASTENRALPERDRSARQQMPAFWTTEQILALSADTSSTKAGRDLASPARWVSLGRTEQAIWGECKGSAREPYQTQVDLSEPAFRCTCPSRKIPCKHALGLFLLLDSDPGVFTQESPPQWVAGWLVGRAERAQRRAEKEEREASASDSDEQARTAARRLVKVKAGLKEIDLWTGDLVRRGLAAAQTESYGFWNAAAARMVDAQAPGVARLIREMGGIASSGEGWEGRLFERLCRLHLLLEGFRRIDDLPPEVQADIRSLVGWTQNQEELLSQAGARDQWLVLGQRVEDEERLRVQRTWLWGRASGRSALLLHFAVGDAPIDASLVPGTSVDAELVFFPSARPLRALLKTCHAAPIPLDSMPGYADFALAIDAFADALARNPWLERFPAALKDVVPEFCDGRWFVRDRAGRVLGLSRAYCAAWHLLALSGGRGIDLFGEWDGDSLLPLSVFAEGRFVVPHPYP